MEKKIPSKMVPNFSYRFTLVIFPTMGKKINNFPWISINNINSSRIYTCLCIQKSVCDDLHMEQRFDQQESELSVACCYFPRRLNFHPKLVCMAKTVCYEQSKVLFSENKRKKEENVVRYTARVFHPSCAMKTQIGSR